MGKSKHNDRVLKSFRELGQVLGMEVPKEKINNSNHNRGSHNVQRNAGNKENFEKSNTDSKRGNS